MTLKEKIEKANLLFEEAKAIVAKGDDATVEEKAKVEPLLDEAQALKAEAYQMKRIVDYGAQMVAEAEIEQDPDSEKQEREDPTEFKEWSNFLQSAYAAHHPQREGPRDPRLQEFREKVDDDMTPQEKQMIEAVGGQGGFLVPTEFLAQLQAAIAESAIVRPRASIIRMRRRSIEVPVLDQTATGVVGQPGWFGGMIFAWGPEALEKVMTEAKFRQIALVAHKLYGYTRASNELVADSAISLGDFLGGPLGLAGGISFMEDYAFLMGTGAGQPLGVITSVNQPTIVVARATAGQITYPDICNMMERFLPSAGNGCWVVTQSGMSELLQMSGPAGNPSYVWAPNAQERVPGYLFGYPVLWSEKVPRIGVQGDILLADFAHYLIGDRQATTVEATQFDRWAYDQTSWRAVHRVNGQPWLSAPITYMDQIQSVSPFVILGDVVAS